MSWKNKLGKISNSVLGNQLSGKLIMIANILLHDWRLKNLFETDLHNEFLSTSDEEITSFFSNLDAKSIANILKFVSRQRDFLITPKNREYFFYNFHRIYNRVEIDEIKEMNRRYKRELKKYKIDQNLFLGGPESLVYHHGLSDCPDAVKNYIDNGVFLDVGGCIGDSALVFLKYYNPERVITFEPSVANRKTYQTVMRQNGVPETKYELSGFGIGKKCSTIWYNEKPGFCNSLQESSDGTTRLEVTTLDKFCSDKKLSNIKVLKADIEGMGLDMLVGAKAVIEQNRPVLNLSIYHNREELFGIYNTLNQWNLNYHFTIKLLCIVSELTLIAWPKELDSQIDESSIRRNQ